MTEIVQPIPARLKNVAVDGHVAGASDIMDDSLNKTQDVINAEVAETIGTGGSVDSRITAAINALDSSKSQSAGADGLALNIVEENGKITSISGSIAPNTYDAYGAASSEATRAQNAESALGGRVTTLETAVGSGGSVDSRIAAAKAEIKGNATSACDTLGEAEALISAEASRAQAAEQSITSTVTSRLDTQDAEIALLNGAEVIVVEDHTQVSSPDSQKIYREIGTSSYTDWMNQGSGWKAIATYNPGIDETPTAESNNLVKSGGVEKRIELRKAGLLHINGEGISSIGFSGFNTNSFHFSMDFVILPNENNVYKDIVNIWDSNNNIIEIGYYTAPGNKNWCIGERLQSSAEYYKEYRLSIYYDNNLLCVSINDNLMKTFSVSDRLSVIFGRVVAEPIGEMLIKYLNFFDNQKFYGVDSITEHYNAALMDDYILKEIEIMRSEQFAQIGTDKVQWIDGTIGDIQSLVFDENSLGVSSYEITYKDYIVTQPSITYNDDYQISNKPEIVITKSN